LPDKPLNIPAPMVQHAVVLLLVLVLVLVLENQ
jgi:hypothetical protein